MSRITAEGGKARFVAADLTDPAQLDHLVDQAGPVDVLVNNAGFSWFGPTADLDVTTFEWLFAANLRPAYFRVAALVPEMAAQGCGRPVLISGAAPDRIEALGATTPADPARPVVRDHRSSPSSPPEGQLRHRHGLCRRRRPHHHLTPAAGGNGAGSRPPFRPARVPGGSNGRSQDQPACPFCCPSARPGWPMKSSIARLTSLAWVQVIACGPPAMTVQRAFVSNAGSLRLVAS